MIHRFNISVITDRVLNNDDKSEVMEAIKSQVGRIKKAGGHLLHDSEIRVSREVGLNDIAEAIGVSTSNTDPIDFQTIKDCKFYDEAQGRHKCSHPFATGRCIGICSGFMKRESYEE